MNAILLMKEKEMIQRVEDTTEVLIK